MEENKNIEIVQETIEENKNVQETQAQPTYEQKKPLTDDEIAANNESWFKFFVYVPKIVAIFMAIFFFIFGIVDASEGVAFDFDGALIVWWLIGAVVSIMAYVVSKLALSYKILHIYLLKKLVKQTQREDKE